VDQRARDTRLGLERIERLLVQRAKPVSPAAKPPSLRLWHMRRQDAA
jgi:hypothetical protein